MRTPADPKPPLLRIVVDAAAAGFARVRARLHGRADSEHEMVINRLVIAILIPSYLAIAIACGTDVSRELLFAVAIFAWMSVGFFVHILRYPGVSVPRRVLAILTDLGMLSYGTHAGGEIAALFYPIYLWIIFGNGFRFGQKYLFLSMGIALAGFGAVVLTTEYWSEHLQIVAGLMLGLVILPIYASTLIRKLSTARQQAEEANKAKSAFLASVSHELRTPLNAVIGLSDLLLQSRLDAEQRDMAQTIGTSGRSLLGLINSILDFSRIEAGRFPSNVIDFDLHALITEIEAMLAVQANKKGLRLSAYIAAYTPRWVRGERRQLEEILVNLTANAVKFTAAGSVTIAVDGARAADGRTHLRVEISDTGIGIAPEARGRIFESFTQADETIIDRFGGTGLGLAIVKQLVELQGGRIGVDSVLGEGSTFWFDLDVAAPQAETAPAAKIDTPIIVLSVDHTLADAVHTLAVEPLRTTELATATKLVRDLRLLGIRKPVVLVDAAAGDPIATADALLGHDAPHAPSLILVSETEMIGLPAAAMCRRFVTVITRPLAADRIAAAVRIAQCAPHQDAASVSTAAESTRKLTILVADDNGTNQKVIGKILERAGHATTIVGDGEAALDALEEKRFDLVLMDINMPVLNGLDATKLYRVAALGRPHVPIVALTADATLEARARCLEAGMDACLTKPIEPARLLDAIRQLVGEAPVGVEAPALAAEPTDDAPAPDEAQAESPVLNRETLDALADLGGSDFVGELAEQFIADTSGVLLALTDAVAANDAAAFRERAHALRSAAANIGAQRIYELCLSWRRIAADDLAKNGAHYVDRLETEFMRAQVLLRDVLSTVPSSGAGYKTRSAA